MFPRLPSSPAKSHSTQAERRDSLGGLHQQGRERDAVSKPNGAAAVPAFPPGPQQTLLSHCAFFTYSAAQMMEMILCKGGMENGSFTLSQSLGHALLLRIFLFLAGIKTKIWDCKDGKKPSSNATMYRERCQICLQLHTGYKFYIIIHCPISF